MIVRGMDFTRHSIIVGNESESPLPVASPGVTDRGQVVARVLAVAGTEATLEVNGERVVVQTHVSLNAGDKLFVRVQDQGDGNLRLSVLASGPEDGLLPGLAEADIDGLLSELGLPNDERTRQAARALLARDGTLDKGALKQLLTALKPFAEVTTREASAGALLQKANVPVSPETVAVVAARAAPNAPPQLGTRLLALVPGLEALARQLPARAAATPLVRDLLKSLSGLPLDEGATTPQVAAALGQWLEKLQPRSAPKSAPPAPLRLQPKGEAKGAVPPALDMGGKRDMARLPGVPASQHFGRNLGITKAEPAPAGPDLAASLEALGKGLTEGHQALGTLVREAVAELRYTQLVNSPSAPTAPAGQTQGAEFLVPLLLPKLSPEHPEGRIQVYHQATHEGEPIDPHNVRLVFVLDTEHLSTVQTEVSIKEGRVDLTMGVPTAADRDFLAGHLDDLQAAIGKLGFETGRFGTRQARGLPPRVRQEEGLTEVVRFDRRV